MHRLGLPWRNGPSLSRSLYGRRGLRRVRPGALSTARPRPVLRRATACTRTVPPRIAARQGACVVCAAHSYAWDALVSRSISPAGRRCEALALPAAVGIVRRRVVSRQPLRSPGRRAVLRFDAVDSRALTSVSAFTWLILPVVICLSQRLSHASVSTRRPMAKPRTAH